MADKADNGEKAARDRSVRHAYLTGGTTKGVTTVITAYDNEINRTGRNDSKYGFIHAEMARFEGANEKQPSQKDAQYFLKRSKGEDGRTNYDTSQIYNSDQIDKLFTAAGPNVQEIYKHERNPETGEYEATDQRVGRVAVVDVDLIFTPDQGLRMNQESAKQTSAPVPENIQQGQFEARMADRKVALAEIDGKAASRAAAKEAEPAPEAAAEPVAAAPAAKADEGMGY